MFSPSELSNKAKSCWGFRLLYSVHITPRQNTAPEKLSQKVLASRICLIPSCMQGTTPFVFIRPKQATLGATLNWIAALPSEKAQTPDSTVGLSLERENWVSDPSGSTRGTPPFQAFPHTLPHHRLFFQQATSKPMLVPGASGGQTI